MKKIKLVPNFFRNFLLIITMTRAEQKALKAAKEEEFIKSIEGKSIHMEEKDQFRKTQKWINFRKEMGIAGVKKFKNGKEKPIPAVDYISHKKLGKRYNCHHLRLDSKFYTDLDPEYFICLNPGMHDDVVHYLYSLACEDRSVLDRLMEVINKMGELNDWKDVKDFD